MQGSNGKINIIDQYNSEDSNWLPVQGDTFNNLLERNKSLSDLEKGTLIDETTEILGNCIAPENAKNVNTGLVIGYVQSGKTLSFTSLIALARDNGFQLVILLAGTTNNLVEQSYERIKSDLDIEGNREWKLFTTQQKGFQNSELERVNMEFSRWRRGNSRAKTILIVSMKHHQHIENLSSMLSKSDLSNVPALIIDDEGDQAGINTKAKNDDESTTYSRIKELRELFPKHSYVSYTATPQAPLLISKIDTISPQFGCVLTPGQNYVGGKEFFLDDSKGHIKPIPISDVPDKQDPPSNPPQSLLRALRDYFVGVSFGLIEGEDHRGKNRSMMIHPAVPKDEHLMFSRWVKKLKQHWQEVLSDKTHHAYAQLLSDFEKSFNDIKGTYQANISFDQVKDILTDAIEETAVVELNTREKNRIPSVDWKGEYSWILIGGIGLDRGFTVEGLTVSYMPRSIGVGNADNIQQRARFFGYKRSYKGLCRIYLTQENIDAFSEYVDHEESIRNSIKRHLEQGKTLKDWRRTYFLDPMLRPTRSSVILLKMYPTKGVKGWIVPTQPFIDDTAVSENRALVMDMLQSWHFDEFSEAGWNNKQVIPKFSDTLKLSELIPSLGMLQYRDKNDNMLHLTTMLVLDKIVNENPDALCSLYAFSGPWSGVPAKRTLNDGNPPKIKNLFQGSNAKTNYPGARELVSSDNVTIQIHRYDIDTNIAGKTIKDVPIIAIHIPPKLMSSAWLEDAV